jgi:hypothetical protein
VSGHGEGWALYAERLMGDLGYLDDLSLGAMGLDPLREALAGRPPELRRTHNLEQFAFGRHRTI